LKLSDRILISGFLIILGLLSLWCIDISTSAMIVGGKLSNGYFSPDPMVVYHIGLYMNIFVIFLNFLVIIHSIVHDKVVDHEEK